MKKAEGAPVDFALLLVRLALGVVFVCHGLQKLFPALPWIGGGGGISGFAEYLRTLGGIPAPDVLAYVAAAWELVGGALVLVGLFPRIAALGLAGVMLVAILKVHLRNGFFLPGGFEFAMTLFLAALAIVSAGSGKYALGGILIGGEKKKPM